MSVKSPKALWTRSRSRRLTGRVRRAERFVPGNSVAFFSDSYAYLLRLTEAVAAAEHTVLVEMYWLATDQIGELFLTACADAASRGVRVILLLDALGSLGAAEAKLKEATTAGVEVHWFSPFRTWQLRLGVAKLTRRNHRKLVIIDDLTGYVGGINIADAWLPVSAGGQAFRDEGLRVRGPIVEYLVSSFGETYRSCTNRSLELPAPPSSSRPSSAARSSAERLCAASPAADAADDSAPVALLRQAGMRNGRGILDAYVYHVAHSRRSVLISAAYFIPTPRLLYTLRQAARRGVEVRIIVPGISDIPLLRFASRATWAPLLSAGVRLFEWHHSVLHSKTAVVDSSWVTIGSFNLDYLSIRSNLELNLSAQSHALAAEVEAVFEKQLGECREITHEDFRRRPWLVRLFERALFAFRRWL